jgi:hypothetical protein
VPASAERQRFSWTPSMLSASWFVCRWCVDRLHVP